MSKQFSSNDDLRQKILKGINTLADNVSTTLGPRGHNVIIHKEGSQPIITKDGATVAKFIDLEDPFENIGAQLVKQASSRTNIDAGDGTTTSTILTRAFLREGLTAVHEGNVSVADVKLGMNKALDQVRLALVAASKQVSSLDDIRHVALVSSNGDTEIADVITTAVNAIGHGGSITIEEARSNKTSLDLLEGFKFDTGLLAKAFVTDERLGITRYEDPLFFLSDAKLESLDALLPALEIAAREGRPIVVVADDIEGQALAALIMNAIRGTMKVAAVKAPRYGEERRQIMTDLALSLGAKYFQQGMGDDLRKVSMEDFGTAKSVVINKVGTTIVGGLGDPTLVRGRIAEIDAEMDQETSMTEIETLQERKNRLVAGVAVIKVGAPTEVEMVEKKHRIEDALEAVRSAQQEGVIPGGGLMFHHLSSQIGPAMPTDSPGVKIGLGIVSRGLKEPLTVLANNAQVNLEEIVENISVNVDKGIYKGYNFHNLECVDMIEEGIIDPAKVARCAIENAISVASTLLTTNAAIVEL